jgi:hypothetical protein
LTTGIHFDRDNQALDETAVRSMDLVPMDERFPLKNHWEMGFSANRPSTDGQSSTMATPSAQLSAHLQIRGIASLVASRCRLMAI